MRRERLLGALDIAACTGLEIGPLNAALVTRDEGRILYVDYATTDVVRANRNDPAIDPATIAEVDIVWGERRLAEAVGERVDYVVASHVIEHVPDLIGWLEELAEVLKPGGVLGLAIPDRRFTFDRLRNDTSVADVVEAWLQHRRQPPARQIFDVAYLGVEADAAALWDGAETSPPDEALRTRLEGALKLATQVHRKPRYVDIHCWVFTPASFLRLAEALAGLGRFPFRIEAFHPTERGAIEFHVRLAASDPTAPAILESIGAAQASLAQAAAPGRPRREADPLQVLVEEMQLTGDELEGIIDQRDHALETAWEEARALREALEAHRASTSWRVTAPLRALARLLGR